MSRARIPNLLESLSPAPLSGEDLADLYGGRPVGANIETRGPRTGLTRRMRFLTPISGLQPQASLTDQMGTVVASEAQATQDAADRQFNRNNAETDRLNALLEGASTRFERAGDAGSLAGQLDDLAGRARTMDFRSNQAQSDLMKRLPSLQELGREIGAAGENQMRMLNTKADEAIAAANSAITGYSRETDDVAIGATVAGMRQNLETELGRIRQGIGANGRLMTAAEKADAERKLKFDTGQQVAMMAASVRSEANKTLASLRTNLASVTLEAGKLKEAAANIGLQAGQIRAGIEGQKNDLAKFAVETMLSSQQGMLQLQQLIGSLNQFKTQLRSNAQIQALEYDLRGRVQSAEQTFRNPETVVGILSGLLAIAGVQTAPGGRNLPGVRF